ncbi:LysR family transcriptional regulator [Cupriavidus neocaledonicus]|uniref:HTH-type transcriptional regulator CatR n=1 Tax=Cupriavidus neocaledonicus TaxID=1040979 RepID=A0A375H4K8_9BURK|nr:LysR family transcriptional regulator [Cupriavidus neocaledonicus]SOZ34898.1 HTH-type transcriptional regulator CatR [Cupriavidus neocaledonicus]SPD46622.1 HTH-type transcriptional regulator CatR [Cupriavidus neocaledonicus]
MELRHLRYFHVVAQELNVTRAAERLHMAQPPLSRQIRQLEDEVGVALFDRVGRGLRLTEAGRFLLEQTTQLTQRLEETIESTRRIGRQDKRWFGIGFVPSVLYGVLPELIRELRGSAQQVEVGLAEMITVEQVEALKSGRIDLGFGRIAIKDPAIRQEVVMTEPLVAAVAASQPAPDRVTLTPQNLATRPFILYPARPRPSYADHLLSLFHAQGLQLRVAQEANELQTALGLVAAGIGITLVPASIQRLHRDDVSYCPIDAPGFVSPVIMSYRVGDSSPFLAQAVAWVMRQNQ